MAQEKAAPKNQKSFEETLWDSANKLRNNLKERLLAKMTKVGE